MGGRGRFGSAVDPARLRRAFWGARWLVTGALLLVVAAAIPVARWIAPLDYVARASFLWERPLSADDPAGDARALRTLIDSVELPTNLAEVRRRFRIHKTLPELGVAVQVTAEDRSSLVVVTARDTDPVRAANIANGMVEVFLARSRDAEAERRRQNVRLLQSDLDQARGVRDQASGRYDAFRRRHGIIDLSLDTQRAIEQAASLRAAAELARADASGEQARADILRSQSRQLPRSTVHETPAAESSSPEREQLARARTELSEARARYSSEHPTVQLLEARVDTLQAEAARAASSATLPASNRVVVPSGRYQAMQGTVLDAEAQRQVALERTRSYEELQLAADERLRQLGAVEGEASSLLADQRVAEAHVTDLETLQARAVDAARSPSAGLRFVNRARSPDSPESRGRQRLAMVGLPAIALLFVLGAVVLRAMWGLRVHTPAELAYWSKGPVVGASSWPREPENLYALVEELDDLYPEATGTTLVVGATSAEREAARQVAQGMAETSVEPIAGPRETWDAAEPSIEQPESRTWLARVGQGELSVASRGPLVPRNVKTWMGDVAGPALRQSARLADRVLVLVRAGTLTPAEVADVRTRLGREDGIGYLLVGVDPADEDLPDREGPVEAFWRGRRDA